MGQSQFWKRIMATLLQYLNLLTTTQKSHGAPNWWRRNVLPHLLWRFFFFPLAYQLTKTKLALLCRGDPRRSSKTPKESCVLESKSNPRIQIQSRTATGRLKDEMPTIERRPFPVCEKGSHQQHQQSKERKPFPNWNQFLLLPKQKGVGRRPSRKGCVAVSTSEQDENMR